MTKVKGLKKHSYINNLKNLAYALPFALVSFLPSCSKDDDEFMPVDTVKPQIEIINPKNNEVFNENQISLECKITEDNFKEAYYKINDGIKNPLAQHTKKDLNLPNDNYTLSVEAHDKSGNIGTKTIYFKINKLEEIVDTIAPKITLFSPTKNTVYLTKQVLLKWATDEECSMNYSINGGSKISIPRSGQKTLTLNNGDYRIILESKDVSFNQNISRDTVDFKINEPVDLTAPTIEFSSPENNKTYTVGQIPFAWNITDENGIASAKYSLNGVETAINSNGSTNFNLVNGDYVLSVTAVDNKSNAKDTTINFFIQIPPTYKYIVNPFVQPNESNLNWYGSGDVDGNNILNANDISQIEKIILGTVVPNLNSDDPIEYRTLDRADVNGDGNVDNADKQILQNRVNGIIAYMPGEWNKLQTPGEREAWFQKMKLIDNTYGYKPGWLCGDYTRQFQINFHGFSDLGYDKTKGPTDNGLKDNGRFNIPVYEVGIAPGPGYEAHAMNGVMTSNNIENFNDWYFIEPQTALTSRANNWVLNYGDPQVKITTPLDKNKYSNTDVMVSYNVFNKIPFLYFVRDNDPDVNLIKTR